MATSTKPRRKYRPRPVAANPIKLALRRASRIPPAEIAAVMEPTKAAFRAMREGVGAEGDWIILAGGVELGLSIERQGVVRGVRGHLTAAEDALRAIKHRAMESRAWKCTPLYWQEIEALDSFLLIHQHQLENLSEGEWRRAHEHATAVVLSAGGQVFDVREIEQGELHLTEPQPALQR
jgi:hypothetical protein